MTGEVKNWDCPETASHVSYSDSWEQVQVACGWARVGVDECVLTLPSIVELRLGDGLPGHTSVVEGSRQVRRQSLWSPCAAAFIVERVHLGSRRKVAGSSVASVGQVRSDLSPALCRHWNQAVEHTRDRLGISGIGADRS